MNERIQNRVAGLLGSLFVTAIVITLGVVGFSPTDAVSGPRWAGSSGGGVASGGAGTFNTLTVTNLTPTEVLFAGPGGAVTDSPNLTFTNPTTSPLLTVGSGTTTSAGVQMGYSGTSASGWVGATGLVPSISNGSLIVTVAGNTTLAANNGNITFRPQGSATTSGAIFLDTAGNFFPAVDGGAVLGKSANRFSSAFLGSSTAITASAPAIDVAQTWNNAGVTFVGATQTVTPTASASASVVHRWVNGSVGTLFEIGQSLNSASSPLLRFGGDTTTGWYRAGSDQWVFSGQGTARVQIVSNLMRFNGSQLLQWASGDPTATSPDTGFARNAAGVVEVNNGTAGTFASIVAANYVGTTTNNSAAVGAIGEYITSSVASSGAIVMNSGTPITTVSTGATVTAGDYDAQGTACYSTAIATSITVLEQGISTSNNTFSTLGSYTSDQFAAMVPLATGTNEICRSTPTVRISLSGTSTVFLVTRGVFTASTLSSYGFLRLRRVR